MEKIIQEICFLSEKYEIYGLDIQNITLCKRREWLHNKNLQFYMYNEDIKIGKHYHDISEKYKNNKLIQGIYVDDIDFNNKIIYERKKSESGFEASENQILLYICQLCNSTKQYDWIGEIYIYSTNKKHIINLSENKTKKLLSLIKETIQVNELINIPPPIENEDFCKKCSFSKICL